ncbi:MAG: hypothetical protein EP343_15875 [Deltaproteobacteria bacterium]|nr:MAG: hypothetical protein EP343_15875 [Deltaproteobacteria bacterium]
MMPLSLDPATQRLVLRIKSKHEVFWAEPSDVFEEVLSLYKGFEKWEKDKFDPVNLDNILKVQKELRLCVNHPNRGMDFCDLSDEPVQSDPFQLLRQASEEQVELWEFNPYQQETRRVYPSSEEDLEWLSSLEDSLFSGS